MKITSLKISSFQLCTTGKNTGPYTPVHGLKKNTQRACLAATTALSVVTLGHVAHAQSAIVNPSQPIEVAATLTTQPLYQTGPSTTIITAKQIAQHNYQTVAAVLRTVPGVELYQTGGPGGLTQVCIRGAKANMTKVILDGINISDPSGGNTVDFSQIPVQNIESIQVIRGPQSGLYGADAIGGVIVITTKQPKAFAPPHLALDFGGGNFGSTSQSGTFTDYYKGLHSTLSYDHTQSSDVMVTPKSDVLTPGQTRNPDYSDRKSIIANFAYDLTPNLTIGSITHYIISELNNTNDGYNGLDYAFSGAEPLRSYNLNREWFLREYATLHSFDNRLTQTIAYVYTTYNRRSLDPNNQNTTPSLYFGTRHGVDYNGSFNLTHDEVLVFGAQWNKDSMSENTPFSAHVSNEAGFIELNSTLPYHLYNSASVRVDANSQFGKHVTFRESPVYVFTPTHTRLHTSIGTGFSAPTLIELYQSYPGYPSNPNLKPETSFGWEVGLDQPLTSPSSAVPITVGTTYFHNHITNMIVSAQINATETSYVNVGKATTSGVESYIDIQPLSSLLIHASYTYLHAQDDITHKALLRRPQNTVSITTTWTPTQRLTLASDIFYNGGWFDINRQGSETNISMPHYTVVNLSATYQLYPQLAFYVRGTNLLNHHYQDPNGFLAPTLGVFGGIKINTNL